MAAFLSACGLAFNKMGSLLLDGVQRGNNRGNVMCKFILTCCLLLVLYPPSVAQARTHRPAIDANGNAAVAIVKSRTGVAVRVARSAREKLQCVIDYVEGHGVQIKSMRGIGRGTVRGSMHPSGQALDINQDDRNVTHPHVPRPISNAAADHCDVISGARWHFADNGHWNLRPTHARHRPHYRLAYRQ
jgi:hypothetical protein